MVGKTFQEAETLHMWRSRSKKKLSSFPKLKGQRQENRKPKGEWKRKAGGRLCQVLTGPGRSYTVPNRINKDLEAEGCYDSVQHSVFSESIILVYLFSCHWYIRSKTEKLLSLIYYFILAYWRCSSTFFLSNRTFFLKTILQLCKILES